MDAGTVARPVHTQPPGADLHLLAEPDDGRRLLERGRLREGHLAVELEHCPSLLEAMELAGPVGPPVAQPEPSVRAEHLVHPLQGKVERCQRDDRPDKPDDPHRVVHHCRADDPHADPLVREPAPRHRARLCRPTPAHVGHEALVGLEPGEDDPLLDDVLTVGSVEADDLPAVPADPLLVGLHVDAAPAVPGLAPLAVLAGPVSRITGGEDLDAPRDARVGSGQDVLHACPDAVRHLLGFVEDDVRPADPAPAWMRLGAWRWVEAPERAVA